MSSSITRACFIYSRIGLLALASAGLFACAPLASVKKTTPTLAATAGEKQASPVLQTARSHALAAQKLVSSNPGRSLAESIIAARLSLSATKSLKGQQASEAIAIYNFAVARMVDAINASKLKPWEKPMVLSGPDGPFLLSMTSDSIATWNPATDKLQTTDGMTIGGTYFEEPARIKGIGAPLVITGPSRKSPAWVPLKHYVPGTAVATFTGNQATIRIVNPYLTTSVPINGKTQVVAADLSASIAVNIVQTHPQMYGLLALLNASKYAKNARLVMMEPYRPGVQPLILVHGLMDSPLTWVKQINALNSNPEIRKRYQIWYFQYGSASPYPIPAAIMRRQLAAVYQKYPQTPKAFVIGHSMGGLIAHMLICDAGTQFCKNLLGKTVAELNLPPEDALIGEALQFNASPYVSKVIFEAAPHRGANMASDPIGRIGSSLVRLPLNMVKAGPELVMAASKMHGIHVLKRFPNSIDTFRPDALVIKEMNKLPLNPSVKYYSIIGNAGRSGPREQSTDDVVPYWSSHLAGAQSEKMVPYWHSAVLRSPETFAEVERILLENK
ncbi:MAG: esterase/lipase family protein [Candidatus Methylacidiphilales bacterium]|nr:alpha/beta hydrolase [Candidatus Methylacidiphilales bacterium]